VSHKGFGFGQITPETKPTVTEDLIKFSENLEIIPLGRSDALEMDTIEYWNLKGKSKRMSVSKEWVSDMEKDKDLPVVGDYVMVLFEGEGLALGVVVKIIRGDSVFRVKFHDGKFNVFIDHRWNFFPE